MGDLLSIKHVVVINPPSYNCLLTKIKITVLKEIVGRALGTEVDYGKIENYD